MQQSKLRRQIAWEAARLMYSREEAEYYRAKQKAAHRICHGWVKPADLPSNAEIRDEIQAFARLHEGSQRTSHLREMRLEALRVMRLLARHRPRLIGSVMTGHVRAGSDIDLHLFSGSIDAITDILDEQGMVYDVERKRVRKHNEERVFTHIHLQDRFPIEDHWFIRLTRPITSSRARSLAKQLSGPASASWKRCCRASIPI